MKTIRWGIIGCGDVTEVKSGPGLYKARNSTLVAVMRRDGARAADYARRHGVPRWTDDADAIITAPDIDVVYVATAPDTHHDYVLRCAAAGKPVFVEKPMARTKADCDAMLAACAKGSVPLWVAYYRRALPRFLKIRELLASGAIGEVRMIASRQFRRFRPPAEAHPHSPPWRVDPAQAGGGYFVDMVTHTLDFLDYCFGPIAEVRAFAGNQAGAYRAEDTISMSYRFASGIFGSGAICYVADRDEEFTEIVGTEGRIRFSALAPVPIVLTRGDATEEFPVGDPPHVHQPLIQTIVDELNGAGSCPSTGETAARTSWVVDRVLEDLRATT
jgi:predicted dehydrogenase